MQLLKFVVLFGATTNAKKDCKRMKTFEGVTFCADDYNIIKDDDPIIRGTSEDDYIKGTDGHDQISGQDGNDLIFGLEGNDLVLAHDGNDVVLGGDDNDMMKGGPGNDIILGGHGNDYLILDEGKDMAYGGPGDDMFIAHDGGDGMFGGEASQVGNTFIIGNTMEHGDSEIKDFWVNEANTIIARDNECDMEVSIDRDDLHSCNSTSPILHIGNEECVVTIYYDSPELNVTNQVCASKDLSCTASRNELSSLHEDLLQSKKNFEQEANDTITDLYNFYLDGSNLFDFTENLSEINEQVFTHYMNSNCEDADKVIELDDLRVGPIFPDECKTILADIVQENDSETNVLEDTLSRDICVRNKLELACREKSQNINDKIIYFTNLQEGLDEQIAKVIQTVCIDKNASECSFDTLESEWKLTNVTVVAVSPEARVEQLTEICEHLDAEYASLELHVQIHDETRAFKDWLSAKFGLEASDFEAADFEAVATLTDVIEDAQLDETVPSESQVADQVQSEIDDVQSETQSQEDQSQQDV